MLIELKIDIHSFLEILISVLPDTAAFVILIMTSNLDNVLLVMKHLLVLFLLIALYRHPNLQQVLERQG